MTEINNLDQFQDFKDEWNTILIASGENNVFSTWEWLSSWWQIFGEKRQLRIMLASDRDRILGIAPLMRTKYHFLRFGNLTKMEFIGCPQSDYSNFILVDRKAECLELFLDRLFEYDDWNCLELKEIPENSASVDMLRKPAFEQTTTKFEERQISTCPYIILPNSADVLLSELKGDMRRSLRRRKKRLSEEFRVEVKSQNDFDSIEEAMGTFYRLHQKRWRSKDVPGVFARKEIRDFHVNVAKLFCEKGWLALNFLAADDEPIAVLYSFIYGQKNYEYLTGFDPQYSRYSVGNLLRLFVIEDCIRRGLKEYDLMRGQHPYKDDWCTQYRKNLGFELFHKGLFAKLYGWASDNKTVLRVTRKFRESLTPKQ